MSSTYRYQIPVEQTQWKFEGQNETILTWEYEDGREKLLNELARLEHERRAGRYDERRYSARREELVAALEQVYGALDEDGSGPEPVDRAGLAA